MRTHGSFRWMYWCVGVGAAGIVSSGLFAAEAASDVAWPPGFFAILPWDPLHGWKEPYTDPKEGLASIAECGFTMAGFVHAADLPACEKLGLKAILAPDRSEEPWFGDWTKLSDEQIDIQVRQMVARGGDSKALLGYFITDEPGAKKFPALAKVVAAVRKHAPGRLAYINLFPDYATIGAPDSSQLGTATYTEYLERFVSEVKPQLISYDNYMVQYSNDLKDAGRAASYYRNLLEIRRVALQAGLPFWNIVSSNQIRPQTPVPSPANLMFQAYTTLAAGAKGLTWYTYYGRNYHYAPVGADGRRTVTWRFLHMVNHQVKVLGPTLSRLNTTGVYFTSPPPVPSLPTLPGGIVKAVESDTPAMVGEFAGPDDADYVMIVNLSLERSTPFRFMTHKTYSSKDAVSAEDGTLRPWPTERPVWLVAGQGVLVRLAPARR